jgi:hypothetical protein
MTADAWSEVNTGTSLEYELKKLTMNIFLAGSMIITSQQNNHTHQELQSAEKLSLPVAEKLPAFVESYKRLPHHVS